MKLAIPFLSVLLTISYVLAAPVNKVKLRMSKEVEKVLGPQHVQFMQKIEGEINTKYIPAMKKALAEPDKHKAAFELSFGDGYKTFLPSMGEKIKLLQNYEVAIGPPIPFVDGTVAQYDWDTKEILVIHDFYRFEWPEAVATIIHEISHAALGTHDDFQIKDSSRPDQVHSTYLEEDFKTVRDHKKAGAKVMIQSASAWELFAHISTNGDVDMGVLVPKSRWDKSAATPKKSTWRKVFRI